MVHRERRVIIIPNNRLLQVVGTNVSMMDACKKAGITRFRMAVRAE